MLLEMHAHTLRYSPCSIIEPADLLRRVVRKGLQGVIITEHHYLWTEDEIKKLKEKAGVEKHFLVLAGQEVETDAGHVLVFGGDKSVPERIKLEALRKLFPSAALVWAHPFRNNRQTSAQELLNPNFDAIEIFNLNHTMRENYLGLMQWHNNKFTATGGSDVHSQDMAGEYPTQFDHPVTTINDVASEIKNGRCRPFIKEIPKSGSDMTVTEITIGTKGDDELRSRIIIKSFDNNIKWEKARESAKITKALYDNGFQQSVFRVPKIIEINEKEKLLIEESQRGKNLFDVLTNVNPQAGGIYYEFAAKWLARFHATKLKINSADDTAGKEEQRFNHYRESFISTGNPYKNDAEKLIGFISARERQLLTENKQNLIQVHGDYHPKNIIIGQDRSHDTGTRFVSVIDFNNSFLFMPSFDAGCFLSQFESQFAEYPSILKANTKEKFIETYLVESKNNENNFINNVNLFIIRSNLSIASFFIKVGKGESKEMSRLIQRSTELMSTI